MSQAVHNHHYHFPPGVVAKYDTPPREVCVATFKSGNYHSTHANLEAAKRNIRSYHGAHITFRDRGHRVEVIANYDDGKAVTLYWLHPNEEVRG